jgi:hypothetical protein
MGVHGVCAGAVSGEAPVQGLNSQEWTQGCEDSYRKMGFESKAPTPTVVTPVDPKCSDPKFEATTPSCPPLHR